MKEAERAGGKVGYYDGVWQQPADRPRFEGEAMSAVDMSLFRPELTFVDFEASDRYDLFNRLERMLSARGYIRATWRAAILEREECYPTGLDCGTIQVAIPHVDPDQIAEPYIAVLKLAHPVAFEGMGGMPAVDAQLVVNLGLLGHEDSQVMVLQALMQLFLDDAAMRDIMRQDTSRALLDAIRRHI